MKMHRRLFPTLACLALIALAAAPARATWSIVLVDKRTNEVAIGSVTCLTGYNLLAIVPVVVVGVGAGACQAAGDFDGIRRPVIFTELKKGTPPEDILRLLAGITGHQQRQYGIVDTHGRAITFTGYQAQAWKGGRIGQSGDLVWAIQGNILAGSCVVPAIESAVINTPGDLAEKLMAGHLAAYTTGGDGRCSCSPQNPTGCGCPPASFTKSGHIGFMVVARIGDTDDTLCDHTGCADGDYYLKLNVPYQTPSAQDPVLQLQTLFQQWRATLDGRPDAVLSVAALSDVVLPPGGTSSATITILPVDWQGLPLTVPIQSVTVSHAPGSSGLTEIGPVVDQGDGSYKVTVTQRGTNPFQGEGIDRFRIVIDDGIRPVSLMPDPTIWIQKRTSFKR